MASNRWQLSNAVSVCAHPGLIAFADESGQQSGGGDGECARDADLPLLRHIVLVHWIAGTGPNTPSYEHNANGATLKHSDGVVLLLRTARARPT